VAPSRDERRTDNTFAGTLGPIAMPPDGDGSHGRNPSIGLIRHRSVVSSYIECVWHTSTIDPLLPGRIWAVGTILRPVVGLDLDRQLGIPGGPRVCRCLSSGAYAELAQHAVDVVLHRVQCNTQTVRDLSVGEA
jgi:hypothetical protein